MKTGKKLWERQVWGTGATQCHPKTNMAAPTPITDGERVYALFATGDLACYDKAGDLVWYRSLVGDYPTIGNNVGMAASPTLWNDLLIVPMENVGESFIGRHRQAHRRKPLAHCPAARHQLGQPRRAEKRRPGRACLPGAGRRRRLRSRHRQAEMERSQAENHRLCQPHRRRRRHLRSRREIHRPAPRRAKRRPGDSLAIAQAAPGYCSPIAHQGLVYVVLGGGVVNCADAKTGEIVWSHRLKAAGAFAASPLLADGKLYIVNEAGVTTVMQAGKEEKVLASNAIEDTILASPVASDGAIFLRSDGALYCIDGKE